MTHKLFAAFAVLTLAACGGEQTSAPDDINSAAIAQELGNAPDSKLLNVQWQGQQTGYWCGPGSTRIALSAKLASPPSQTTLANYMGTTTNGTDHVGLVAGALNHYENTNVFFTRNISDPATAAQRDQLQRDMVAAITNGYAFVVNVVSGWRPPGYPGGTIYHYVAVVGYDQGGARAQIADPAGGGAAGSSWGNVPTKYFVSIGDLATWIGGKGYAANNLPIVAGTVTPPSTTGVLTGAIYQQGASTNRVAGATVTVSGKTVTTAADGLYKFDLPAGSYTVNVSKSGYGSNSVTRTVTAGATVWGSMEINAAAATGTLKGKVYAFNAANPSDMSVVVVGATVTAGGQTATTGADGVYTFTLAAGTYTVNVSKAGFTTNSLSRAVTVGATVWGSVGLTSSTTPPAVDSQPPSVAISYPLDKAELDLAVFNLTGTASDDKGAVGEVEVSLNGGAAAKTPVTGGKFSIEVKLKPGANVLKVLARDAAGNNGTVTQTAVFNAGVSGFVHLEGDEAQRVGGAKVSLLEKVSGTKVAEGAVNAQTGAFALNVSAVPADFVLVASAPGYKTSHDEITVPDDQRLNVKVGLLVGADSEMPTAGVKFNSPKDGASLDAASVVVKGTVSGFELATVKVNGLPATISGSDFSVEIPLTDGLNTIEAVATAKNGNVAKASIKVTRPVAGSGPSTTKTGCSALGMSELQLMALLALLPTIRRRRK